MMKRVLFILSLVYMTVSCGPSRHAIPVEMRYPSKSGLELAGKIVSVIYSVAGDECADRFNQNLAEAFAKALEKDYGTGEGSVGLHAADNGNGLYSSKDSLFSFIMSTGADLVILFDIPEIGDRTGSTWPIAVKLYCYDGMDRSEKVHMFSGSTSISASDQQEQLQQASDSGRMLAESFVSQWKQEQYSIAYYDSFKWYEALIKAEEYDWKGAMEIWFTLLDSKDVMKRACAEYNIAVACYMLGDFSLAAEWLDRSDEENRIPTLSDSLRKRIEARK